MTTGSPRQIVRSASAAGLSSVWRMAVTFATHLALRRLIGPEEMGVWTWAEPVFILLAQVRDLGVPGHLVRHTSRPYGTYLRLQLFWGGGFSLALAGAAGVLALGFQDADDTTVAILRALCVFLFVQGLGSVPLTFFEVENRIERTIPAELARNFTFAALSIALALAGYGVWSLVIAHLCGAAVYAALLWWSAWGEIVLERYDGAVTGFVATSLPLALMSILELSVLYLDPLILGLRLEEELVGVAGLALFAVFFFSRQIADAAGRAVYPALVRYREDLEKSFLIFRVATLFLASLVVPAAFFFYFNAEWVAWVLGGDRWVGAADYLRVAAFVPLLRPLVMFGRELLLTHHRDRALILYTSFNLVSLSALGLWLVSTPLEEVGMAVASYFPLGVVVLTVALYQLSRTGLGRTLRDLATLYGIVAVSHLPLFFLPPDGLRLGASVALGAVACLLSLWRFRADFREFFALESSSAHEERTVEPAR